MEDHTKGFYKYCIVPMCKNTSSSTPTKLFFSVPRHEEKRREWCQIMKREPLSTATNRYCCEDHFDVSLKSYLFENFYINDICCRLNKTWLITGNVS